MEQVGGTMPGVIRRSWEGSERENDLLEAAVKDVRFSREADKKAWESVRQAREGGVPDTVLCARTEISRSTLNRVLGPRKSDEQD
jgi:hypothetical protein